MYFVFFFAAVVCYIQFSEFWFSVILSYTCSCQNIYICAGYIPTQWTIDAMIMIKTQWQRQTQEDFLENITSRFIARVRKGCVGFYCERELEIEHNCNILTPHSYDRHVVSFLFSWCSTGGLGAHSSGWSAISYQQLLRSPNSIRVPEGPLGRVWLSLPHLVSNCVRSSTQLAGTQFNWLVELNWII